MTTPATSTVPSDAGRRIRVVLCALTGFGNTVLHALLGDPRVDVGGVFTKKYEGPFPYYPEQQLVDACKDHGVDCHHAVRVSSEDGMAILRAAAPDLMLVATFKQILKDQVLALPTLGVVNLHPSLLPRHRGPCPTSAALLSGDTVTGVTAHYATEGVDEGDILLQRSVAIAEDDDDGRLRHRLARLAGEMVPDLIGMFSGFQPPVGAPQDHRLATRADRPTEADTIIDPAEGIEVVCRKIRALNPYPGTRVLADGRWVAVHGFTVMSERTTPTTVTRTEDVVDLRVGSRIVRLFTSVGVSAPHASGQSA